MEVQNGIILKSSQPILVPRAIERRLVSKGPGNTIFELVQWQKRWDVRSVIMSAIGRPSYFKTYRLSPADLKKIRQQLIKFCGDEIELFAPQILVLDWFRDFLSGYESRYFLEFYDGALEVSL